MMERKETFCADICPQRGNPLHRTCTRLAQNHVQNGSAKPASSKCTKTGLKPYDFNPVFVSFSQEIGLSDKT